MIRSNLAIDAGRSFGFGVGEARGCGGMLMPRGRNSAFMLPVEGSSVAASKSATPS